MTFQHLLLLLITRGRKLGLRGQGLCQCLAAKTKGLTISEHQSILKDSVSTADMWLPVMLAARSSQGYVPCMNVSSAS